MLGSSKRCRQRRLNTALDAMSEFARLIERWGASLCQRVSVSGLISRCKIAYKWKAPYRCLVIREALFWRMHDLGMQILCLMGQ